MKVSHRYVEDNTTDPGMESQCWVVRILLTEADRNTPPEFAAEEKACCFAGSVVARILLREAEWNARLVVPSAAEEEVRCFAGSGVARILLTDAHRNTRLEVASVAAEEQVRGLGADDKLADATESPAALYPPFVEGADVVDEIRPCPVSNLMEVGIQ